MSHPAQLSALHAPISWGRQLVGALAPRLGGRIAARFRRTRARLWLCACVLLTWAVYAFFVSAGGLRNWPVLGTFHDLMADGFRAGQLSLLVSPPPELLAAKDPYNRVNIRYWILDLSLYRGKYYIYWGPVPALLQAAAKSVLGIRGIIGDQYLALFFLCVASLCGALIIERMTRRLFGLVSRWVVVLGILAFAFANPALHAATTPGTYHTAILSGQAWLLFALVAAFDAVWHAGTDSARRSRLVLAGCGWALALASRVTLLPAIAIFIALTAVAEGWASERRWLKLVTNAFWLGLPVATTGFLLLVYNKLRFDSWFEFGSNLQLSGYPRFRLSTEYLLPNLYSYTLRSFESSCQFPFLFQEWWKGAEAFPDNFKLPADYMVDEPVVGWLRAVPLTWLIPLAFVFAPRPLSLRLRQTRSYLWCLGCFSVLASITGLVGMGVYGATMRYLSDVTYGLVLLALLGGYAFSAHRLGKAATKAKTSFVSLLALATAVMGALIGYQGYNGHFRANPKLDAKLVAALSVCGGQRPASIPRYHP